MSEVEFSIVMPCLNEAETLAVCIEKARKSISQFGLDAEIVIADNGSTDGSQQIASDNGAKVVEVKDKGYGCALHGGISAARGRYIIMGDADDSYDFADLGPFIQKLRAGYDLVMGCRFPSGGGRIMPGAMPLKHRFLGNPVLSFIGKLFFRSPVTDFHCGLRGFSRDAFLRMNLQTTGMEFASEMVMAASLSRMRIAEVPITLYKDGRSRAPHLRSWRDGWRHLRFMLMYCPRWLFFYPGIVLFLAGTAFFFLILMRGSLVIGGMGFESNSLLVAGMTALIGFQLTTFYFFTKTFAAAEGLLPEDRAIRRFTSLFSLEVGIVLGALLFLLGLAVLSSAMVEWKQVEFGALSHGVKLRKIIPAILSMLLGVQIVLSRFFLSILGLRRKHLRQI